MPIPAHFYFTRTQSSKKYQKAMSGVPDFSRLMRGLSDFWISPQNSEKPQPKKIVLTLSVLFDCSFEYRKHLRELLTVLATHHFSLFINYQEDIYPLEPIHFDAYCDDVYIPNKPSLISWNKEQTLCLDLYDIQCCFQDIISTSFNMTCKKSYFISIDSSVITKFQSNTQTQYISDMSNESYIEQLDFEDKTFEKLFPSSDDLSNVEFFKLTKENLSVLKELNFDKIHSLTCSGLVFDALMTQYISSMSIHTLELQKCTGSNYSFLPKTITHLTLWDPDIDKSTLIHLLQHLTHLKSLTVYDFEKKLSNVSFSHHRFNNIVKLSIPSHMCLYLGWFPEIIFLELDGCAMDNMTQLTANLNANPLPNLVEIKAAESHMQHLFLGYFPNLKLDPLIINLQQLSKLNTALPNIKKVNLTTESYVYLSKPYEPESIPMHNIPKLKTIFPHIKTLDLPVSYIPVMLDNIVDSSIENLCISNDPHQSSSIISPEIFCAFLAACPKLNSLSLHRVASELFAHPFWKRQMIAINQLFLSGITVERDFFICFLPAFHHLDSLTIEEIDEFYFEFSHDVPIPYYPQLKYLTINIDEIDFFDLIILLSIFNQIEFLDITITDLTTHEITYENQILFPVLENLKTIEFDENLPIEAIYSLLHSCPQLDEESKNCLQSAFIAQSLSSEHLVYSNALIWDADPTPSRETPEYDVTEIFSYVYQQKRIKAAQYRLQTFANVTPNSKPCLITQALTLSNTEEDSFIAVAVPPQKSQSICLSSPWKKQINKLRHSSESLDSNKEEEGDYLDILLEALNDTVTTTDPLFDANYELSDLILLEEQGFGHVVKGSTTIKGTPGWHPLPSLSPNEELLCYEADDATPLAFNYSTRDNLFYVKTVTAFTPIAFYLFIPKQDAFFNALHVMSDDHAYRLNAIYNYYVAFSEGRLPIPANTLLTGFDYIDLLNKHRVGSCRHRAMLFKHSMEQQYPGLPCRIVINQVHAFIELQLDGHWYSLQLGGYPGKINYKKPFQLESFKPEAERTNLQRQHQKALMIKTDSDDEEGLSQNQAMRDFTTKLRQCRVPTNKVDFHDFIEELITMHSDRRLIECETVEELDRLQYGLQRALQTRGYPVYYIHKPVDLHCTGPTFVLLEDESVAVQTEKHPLFLFLSDQTQGCLIVNYDSFSAEEYVAYNDMLDDKRVLHGLPIPPHINIIGLRRKIDFVPEQDFYSRFKTIQSFPFTAMGSIESIAFPFQQGMNASEQAGTSAAYAIQLFNSLDWESLLLGKWMPTAAGWHFQKGQLVKALEAGEQHISLHNAPWDNADFCHFWKQAAVDNSITYAGRTLMLSPTWVFSIENGYDHQTFFGFNQSDTEGPYHILNAYTFNFFFQNVSLKEGALVETDGYIAKATSSISVLLSEPISHHQWAKFVMHCNARKLALHVAMAPSVDHNLLPFITQAIPKKQLKLLHTRFIYTNDMDGLLDEYADDYVIDVSECAAGELINSITVELGDHGFSFGEQTGFLEQPADGKRIILKGTFSPQLVAELTPLLLKDLPGLVVITENNQSLSFFEFTEEWVDQFAYMKEKYGDGEWLKSCQKDESIARMAARYHYWKRTNDQSTDKAWQGMLRLEQCHKKPSIELIDNEQVCRVRGQLIRTVLATQPYVYIAGISGVGKSTYIKEQFISIDDDEVLFIGDSQDSIKSWVHSSRSFNVLFIDEANLSQSQFSRLESLFLKQPAFFYDRIYHVLSDKHKVIFAGNPLNYGDERHFSRFFERHGNAIIFEPLPISIIDTDILQPILKNKRDLIDIILTLYTQLCELSENELLITPRELQALALLARHGKHDTLQPVSEPERLNYNIYYMLKGMLDDVTFLRYCEQFKVTSPKPPQHDFDQLSCPEHVLMPSRYAPITLLMQQLRLHQRRTDGELTDNLSRYSGLGGVLIEGAVGLGKSELVKSIFKYMQVTYVLISASMTIDEKTKRLLSAFDSGCIAWMDELNTSPVLEQLLNHLLMGKTERGELPRKPGFMLIVTQNPSDMLGRRQLSPALLRRFLILHVDDYTLDEMVTIFTHKGMDESQATALANAYQMEKAHVSFRDALKLCFCPAKGIKRTRSNATLFSSTASAAAIKRSRLSDEEYEAESNKLQKISKML